MRKAVIFRKKYCYYLRRLMMIMYGNHLIEMICQILIKAF